MRDTGNQKRPRKNICILMCAYASTVESSDEGTEKETNEMETNGGNSRKGQKSVKHFCSLGMSHDYRRRPGGRKMGGATMDTDCLFQLYCRSVVRAGSVFERGRIVAALRLILAETGDAAS